MATLRSQPSGTDRGPRGKALSALVIVVMAAVSAVLVVRYEFRGATLHAEGGPAQCSTSTASPIGFGQVYFALSSKSAKVTVTDVSLVKPTGGLHLDRAAFVPNGGAGSGFQWSSSSIPARWLQQGQSSLQRSIPTVLDETAARWQLVVAVSVPNGSTGGYADAVRVTYSSDGRTRHVTGHGGVGIFADQAGCAAAG